MASQVSRNVTPESGYAHVEGLTCACYTADGSTILTGGADGDVRVWKPDNDSFDSPSYSVGSFVYGLAVKGDYFYVASDLLDLKYYSINDGSLLGTKLRSTLAIYCINISKDGQILAAGGSDFMIKVLNLEDDSLKTLNGHEAPVLSLSIDPQAKYIASSSCDGTVRIWEIETLECVKAIDNHTKSNDIPNSDTLCQICWNNKGSLLFVPNKSGIALYNRESWAIKSNIVQQGFENVVAVDISHDDKFIAAANQKGSVVVWAFENNIQSLLSTFVSDKASPISSLKWNPNNSKKLIATDKSGYYHLLTVDDSSTCSQKSYDYGLVLDDFNLDVDFSDEEDDGKKKPEEETTQDINNQKIVSKPSSDNPDSNPLVNSPMADEMNLDDDDDNEFDIGKLKAEYEPKIFGTSVDDKASGISYLPPSKDPQVAEAIRKINDLTLPILQAPFQPGSSPIEFEERYMKWNSVGIITSINEENENNIHIEFHDTTTSHSRHFLNSEQYTMADLSADAIAFANSETEENEGTSSRIFCILLNGMGDSKDWQVSLPRSEYAEAITLGDGFLGVATDKRNIRVFTIAGMQLFLFSIAGPVVCMAAQEQSLMIIYHSGSGLPGEQSLSMIIVKINSKDLIGKRHHLSQPVQVALSPLSSLSWAGFTDEGTPCTVDSQGVVRLYKDFIGNFWMPILDFDDKITNKADHYFVIGLTEIGQQVRCILCKGSRFPSVVPRPAPTAMGFMLSICDRDNTKGTLEEKYMLSTMCQVLLKSLSSTYDLDFQLTDVDKKLRENLIKLFAVALSTNSDSLALDIANQMINPKTLEGAHRYATQRRKMAVAKALEKIIDERTNDDQNCESGRQTPDSYIPSPKKDSILLENYSQDQDFSLRPKPLGRYSRRALAASKSAEVFGESSKERCRTSIEAEFNEDNAFENFLAKKREFIITRYDIDDEDELQIQAAKMFKKLSKSEKMSFDKRFNQADSQIESSSSKRKKLSHRY